MDLWTIFMDYKYSNIFGLAAFRTAQCTGRKGERAFFCLFFGVPDPTLKKLNMIAKEFEFVVGRMY